ncbi:Crp/Fnr family transcriptional regulator [Aquimarina macrocephali]|uniref:Crp/Fnr family transcriptional regulator n=1 Tax=Aquimarina macrocephali TaxID=666563 RepID=UPI000464D167|nr:Crp/Fnr family transcriptional regulator [Aquimarina macrocephali]
MSNQLFIHINQFIEVNECEFQKILTFFNLCTLNKKDTILRAGNKCNLNFFVLKGCIQMYFFNDKGIERTVRFAIENRWMTDYLAYQNKTTTDFHIQAVEITEILAITYEKQEKLLTLFPKLEKYFRKVYETSYGKSLLMMKYLYNFSKEDIYFHFTEQSPELAQRLPQNLIASFLGLTPEYLSKIKNKNQS